jgi:hypothetical protein
MAHSLPAPATIRAFFDQIARANAVSMIGNADCQSARTLARNLLDSNYYRITH